MNYDEWAKVMRQQQANNQFSLNPPNLPYSPNGGQMVSQNVPSIAQLTQQASYDPSSTEAMIAQLMSSGQEQLLSEGAQGKQVGDIYAQPTWADNLNTIANKLVGGYQMRQARQMQNDVNAQKKEAAAATGALAQKAEEQAAEETAYQRGQDTLKNTREDRRVDMEERRAEQSARESERRFQMTMAKLEAAQDKASQKADENKAKDVGKKAEKLDSRMDRYVDDLRMTNIEPLQTRVNQIDKLLVKLPKDKDGNVTNVPGTGFLQNDPGFVGGALTAVEQAVVPDSYYGGVKPSDMRSARQGLQSELLKAMSGAAVTLPEQLRAQVTNAMEWTSSDADFMSRWPDIKETIQSVQDYLNNSYGPDVVGLYNQRREAQVAGDKGMTSEEWLSSESREAAPKQKESTGLPSPQTQEDFDALPSGAEYIDPDDGKRYRKP